MANTIITKNSATATAVPTAGQLVQGELAVNVTDKRLFTENSGGTVVELGTNPSQVNFADNAKAIFGAGSDLQIYHDGAKSVIEDQGTGNLVIRGSSQLILESSSGANYLLANDGSDVKLYYNTSVKFATIDTGIDVTGDVVASGDISANGGDVDITGAQPRINLHENDTTDLDVTLRLNAGDFIIETRSDAGTALGDRIRAASNGDISFFEDTGTTAKFYWDASAESLGIGTSSPSSPLEVNGGTANRVASFISTDASGLIEFADNATTNRPAVGADGNDLALSTNGEKVRITSAGNVGIGTDSPKTTLTVQNGGVTGLSETTFAWQHYQQAASAYTATSMQSVISGASASLTFSTAPNWTNGNAQERMRIDSSGNLNIGNSGNFGGKVSLAFNPATQHGIILAVSSGTFTNNYIAFQNSGGSKIGSISSNNSSVAYNTSSDYRLKENVVGVTSASERVQQLNPVRFNFIADSDRTVDGFLAHEVAEVVPEAITGEKDAIDADGKPEYQGIDQSKLVPLLTAALQEALAQIESLTARVSALEGN